MNSQELEIAIANFVRNGINAGLLQAQSTLTPLIIPVQLDNSQISSFVQALSVGARGAMTSAVNSFTAGI